MKKNRSIRPIEALIAGAFIISFSSVLVRISDVAPTVSAFYRTFFGSIVLVCACIIKKEIHRKAFKKQILAVFCGLIFALNLWSWHQCILLVGPGLATILGNFQVFILSIAGFALFKEKIHAKFIIAVPLAFIGLFAIIGLNVSGLGSDYITGIFYGLLTAFLYSIYLLLIRHIQSDDKNFSLFYYLMVLSLVSSFCLAGNIHFSDLSFAIPTLTSFASLLCLGIVIQAAAWVMISNALPQVNASHAGLILLLQPALSFVWDVVFFKRPTDLTAWAGVGIVLFAIYLGMNKGNK